jgi:hypothetical protein
VEAEVEFRWKEQVIYWEGTRGFVFESAWGVSPYVTAVPHADSWDDAVPRWLKGRRDEVIARLSAEEGHIIRAEAANYPWDDPALREVTRPEPTSN